MSSQMKYTCCWMLVETYMSSQMKYTCCWMLVETSMSSQMNYTCCWLLVKTSMSSQMKYTCCWMLVETSMSSQMNCIRLEHMPGSRLTAHGSQPRTRKYLFFTKSFQEKTTGIAFNFVSTSKNKDLRMIRRKKKKKVKKRILKCSN